MQLRDSLGQPITGATQPALLHFENALAELQCYRGDPMAVIDKAILISPEFVMAHAMKGWLNLLGTDPQTILAAREAADLAHHYSKLGSNDRELGHVAAISAMAGGHFLKASRILEDVSISHPRDGLALLAGHQIDFFTGQSRMLRDRISRAMPHWDKTMPGFHSMLGMQAFGLEEMGDYARAEALGRQGVDIEPRDGWSQHAVAHVLEMQARHEEGVKWMEGNADGWTGDSFLQVHNWWHLALYRVDTGDFDSALKLYDERIGWGNALAVLDKVDAASLLWRLHLKGVDVGKRFKDIASRWQEIAGAGNYTFNDAHAVMAFSGAGQIEMCQIVFEAQNKAMLLDNDNAIATREIGRPVCEAFVAFAQGDYAHVVNLLRPIRNTASKFGGSHAQRDVIDLTLIEAAVRSGNRALGDALAFERTNTRH